MLFSAHSLPEVSSFCDFKHLAYRHAWVRRKMEEVEIHMISLLSGNELMLGYERDNVGLKKVGSEMGRLAIV